jgi:hypothetical protein
MADETFEMFVARERARLNGEREAIFREIRADHSVRLEV